MKIESCQLNRVKYFTDFFFWDIMKYINSNEVVHIATINDISKLAGVAQGTVSNVLNGRDNVSSEKIRRVLEAADKLGYTINEKARRLRKGYSNTLAVVLPSIGLRHYTEFYQSFKKHAENCGYTVSLYTTDDRPQTEISVIQRIKAETVAGAAVYSSFFGDENFYAEAGFPSENILFVERNPQFPCHYIGFNYAKCGRELADKALSDRHKHVTIITNSQGYSNELILLNAFLKRLKSGSCQIEHAVITPHNSEQDILALFEGWTFPKAVFLASSSFAESVRNIWVNFYNDTPLSIYTISSFFTLPETNFIKYELDYRYMGKTSAEMLISREGSECRQIQLENYGFRDWGVSISNKTKKPERITVLTLDSPEAFAMKALANRYMRETGVDVRLAIHSYDEILKILSALDESSDFDVLRMDLSLLAWFSQKILRPLDEIDNGIASHLEQYADGIMNNYSIVHGKLYALPSTPSVQLLYYRKDLFENIMLRRLFQETYKAELAPPSNFQEFNRIARFFTKQLNPLSPVEYGSSLALGYSGVIGSEFLVRFFSYSENFYNETSKICIDNYAGQKALEDLIELYDLFGGYSSKWWTDVADEFAARKIAMTILYSNFASGILDHSSNEICEVGVAPVPGGSPLIGGGSLGVSLFSKFPEEALQFIKWICSEPISSAATLLGGTSACTKTYENREIVETYPWLELVKNSFAHIQGLHKFSEKDNRLNERQISGIIATGVRNTLNNTFTSKEALKYMQKELEKFS